MAAKQDDLDALQQQFDKLQAAHDKAASDQKPTPVIIQKERKLRQYKGTAGEVLSSWSSDARDEILAKNLTGKEAADLVLSALDGSAKAEIKCRSKATRGDAEAILSALKEVFGDARSAGQHLCSFYSRKQGAHENIMEYSHALANLLEAYDSTQKTKIESAQRETMLNEQFRDNVAESQLRWELREFHQRNPTCTFIELRQVAIGWQNVTGRRSQPKAEYGQAVEYSQAADTGRSAQQTTVAGNDVVKKFDDAMKVMEQLVRQNQTLIDELRGQRDSGRRDADRRDDQRGDDRRDDERRDGRRDYRPTYRGRRRRTVPRDGESCYTCHDPNHYQRDCEQYRRQQAERRQQPRQDGDRQRPGAGYQDERPGTGYDGPRPGQSQQDARVSTPPAGNPNGRPGA